MPLSGTREPGTFGVSCRRLEDVEKAALSTAGYSGDGIVVRMTGELDLATVVIAEAELYRAEAGLYRAEAAPNLIVLDLRGIRFIDSTGLRLILGADRRARARGDALVIANPAAQVRRLFDLSGIASHLHVIESLARSFNPPA